MAIDEENRLSYHKGNIDGPSGNLGRWRQKLRYVQFDAEDGDVTANDVLQAFQSARVLYDLGCGKGDSTEDLLLLSPNAEVIYPVDSDPMNIFQLNHASFIHESNVQYNPHFGDITDFLQREDKLPASIAILRGVPTHHLDTDGGYQNLADSVEVGGLVVEMVDTQLDAEKMKKCGFEELRREDDEFGFGLSDIFWQKKASEEQIERPA
jgi:trans-aconitate methyltransferase